MTNSLSQSAQVIHLASQQLWYASILSILSHLASPADRQVIGAGMNWSIDVLLYPVIDCILACSCCCALSLGPHSVQRSQEYTFYATQMHAQGLK